MTELIPSTLGMGESGEFLIRPRPSELIRRSEDILPKDRMEEHKPHMSETKLRVTIESIIIAGLLFIMVIAIFDTMKLWIEYMLFPHDKTLYKQAWANVIYTIVTIIITVFVILFINRYIS